MRRQSKRQRDEVQIDMTPMLDIVFIMLIFFIVTTSFVREAGLEVQERDGNWLPINPPPGSAVVNIGDMLERHTNDVLPSTSHRVVNPPAERARYSRYATPFFVHYRPDFLIETIPSCVTADNPNRYPEPITANAFLLQRLAEIKLT